MRSYFTVPDGFKNATLWDGLLRKWLDLLRQYEKSKRKDLGYWHGERPLTGFLAAAAWLLEEGWSIEEFSAKRLEGDRKTAGRGDLRVGLGKAEATIEAKIYWANQQMPTAKRKLRERLGDAKRQLRALTPGYRFGDAVSVCYVVPWFTGPAGKRKGRKILTELEAWATSEKMAIAKHLTTIVKTKSEGSEYPGVLLVARQESWPEKKR